MRTPQKSLISIPARTWSPFLYMLIVPLLTLAWMSPSAFADGVYVEVTGFPHYDQTNTGLGALGGSFDGGALSPESTFSWDLRNTLGYTFWDHLLIAGSYNVASASSKRDAGAVADSQDKKVGSSEWGPTLGFVQGGFHLLGTYFVRGRKTLSEKDNASDGSVAVDYNLENKKGTGYQFTLGYALSIARNFKIGPSLVYRHMTYKTQSLTNTLDPTANYTDRAFTTNAIESNLTPMVTLMLQF